MSWMSFASDDELRQEIAVWEREIREIRLELSLRKWRSSMGLRQMMAVKTRTRECFRRHEAGETYTSIARDLGIRPETVKAAIDRFRFTTGRIA